MYVKGFPVEIVEESAGEVAGLKSGTIKIDGNSMLSDGLCLQL